MYGVEFTAEWIAAVSIAFTTFISSVVAAIISLRQAFTKQTAELKSAVSDISTKVDDVQTTVTDVKDTVNGGSNSGQ